VYEFTATKLYENHFKKSKSYSKYDLRKHSFLWNIFIELNNKVGACSTRANLYFEISDFSVIKYFKLCHRSKKGHTSYTVKIRTFAAHVEMKAL